VMETICCFDKLSLFLDPSCKNPRSKSFQSRIYERHPVGDEVEDEYEAIKRQKMAGRQLKESQIHVEVVEH
jgi:hypothetical protein